MDTVAIQEGGERGEMEEEEEEEEDPGITDIDEPTPRFTKPISTLPGTLYIYMYMCMYVARRTVYSVLYCGGTSETSKRTGSSGLHASSLIHRSK